MKQLGYFGKKEDYDECIRLLEQVREIDKDNHFVVQIFDRWNAGALHLEEANNYDSYHVEDLRGRTLFRANIYPVGEVIISCEQFKDAIRCLVYDRYKKTIF